MWKRSGKTVLVVSLVIALILCVFVLNKFLRQRQSYRTLVNSDFSQSFTTFFPDQNFQEKPSPRSSEEIEINWVSKAGFPAIARINLPTKTWFYSGTSIDPSALAQSPTMPLTDQEIDSIRGLLANLPVTSNQSVWNRDDYKNEYHIAYYAGDKLIRYHYLKTSPPVEFQDLLRFLKIQDFYK